MFPSFLLFIKLEQFLKMLLDFFFFARMLLFAALILEQSTVLINMKFQRHVAAWKMDCTFLREETDVSLY